MSFLSRIFGKKEDRDSLRPLYEAVVQAGRDPAWYREGAVPDTIDGRFDMIAAILSLILIRLEREGEGAARDSVLLTELFIDDMDGTLRQIGIGDFVVGKHLTKMMGALGGRLGAFRAGLEQGSLKAAVHRNIFRAAPPSEEKAQWVAERLQGFSRGLDAADLGALLAGRLPKP